MSARWRVGAAGLCVVAVALTVSLRALALDPTRAVADYVSRVWDTKHGLPQATIYALAQTRDGYLWLGTEEGLVRFDGVRFVTYNRTTTPELRSNLVRRLYEDHAGDLWIAPRGGGLTRLRGGTFRSYGADDGLPSDTVWSIAEDPSGHLVLGTQMGVKDGKPFGGLSCFDGARFHDCGFNDVPGEHTLAALFIDPDGTTWVGGATAGLARKRGSEITIFGTKDGLSDEVVYALYRDHRGVLWAGTGDGKLNAFDGTRFTPYAITPTLTDHVLAIGEDKNGNLWAGTRESGVVRFGRATATPKLESRTLDHGLPSSMVFSLLEDTEGDLWVGTMTGLVRLRDPLFTVEDGASMVWSVAVDDKGAPSLATQQHGLRTRDPSSGAYRSLTTRDGLASDDVFGMFQDDDGSMWLGSHFGLNHVKDGAVTVFTMKDGLPLNDVVAVLRDRRRRLWVGTWGGLTLFDEDRAVRTWTTKDGLASTFVVTMLETRDGRLYIGTDGGGLAVLEDGKIRSIGLRDGLSDNLVYALYEDDDGALWIGTMSGGVNRLKDGKIAFATTRDGLFDNAVYAIVEDDRHDLWMSCGHGIFRVARAELEALFEGRARSVTSIAYAEADGLIRSECNYGSAVATKASDGRLFFATGAGAAVVDPARMPRATQPLPVIVEELLVNRVLVPIAERLSLPAGSREFELRYTAIGLASPERVRFRYRLDGFDREWIDAGDRRVVYYTNLAPGRYALRVIAANADGVWSDAGASLAFYVEPHFYQTYSFYGAVLAVALLVIFGAHRVRVRRLSAHAKELAQRVDERTREIEGQRAELARAFRALKEKDEVLDEDLAQARAFQQSLIPAAPEARTLRFAGRYRPADVVGGDVYEISEIAPGRFRVFLADTTGHGVQASMRTMVLKTEYVRWRATTSGPADLLAELNRALVRSFPRLELRCSACCFDVIVAEGGGATLVYANAGQLPLLWARRGPPAEVSDLYVRGPYLGMTEDATFAEIERRLEPGDRVIAYTDGLVEQDNAAREAFGVEALRTAVAQQAASLEAVLSEVVRGVEHHAGEGKALADDVTLVALEVVP